MQGKPLSMLAFGSLYFWGASLSLVLSPDFLWKGGTGACGPPLWAFTSHVHKPFTFVYPRTSPKCLTRNPVFSWNPREQFVRNLRSAGLYGKCGLYQSAGRDTRKLEIRLTGTWWMIGPGRESSKRNQWENIETSKLKEQIFLVLIYHKILGTRGF